MRKQFTAESYSTDDYFMYAERCYQPNAFVCEIELESEYFYSYMYYMQYKCGQLKLRHMRKMCLRLYSLQIILCTI
jgi:hypothetical protein